MKVNEKIKLIESFINVDIISYVKNNYFNNLDKLFTEDFLSIDNYNKLSSCIHNMDKRDVYTFAKEVVLSWILEDYIKNLFSNCDYLTVEGNGTDAERTFSYNKDIKNASDLILKSYLFKEKQEIKLEIVTDYNNFWNKTKKMHLRDNKFKKLLEEGTTDAKTKNTKNVWVFGIDIQNKQFYIINVNKNLKVKKIENHAGFGGKSATEIDLNSKNCNVFTVEEFLKHIECNNRKYNKKKVA